MKNIITISFLIFFTFDVFASHKMLPSSKVVKQDIDEYVTFFQSMVLECRKKFDKYGHPKKNYTALIDWANCVWEKDEEYYLFKEHQLLIIPNFPAIAEKRYDKLFNLAKQTSIDITISEDTEFINLRLKRFVDMTNDIIKDSLTKQIDSYNNYINSLKN